MRKTLFASLLAVAALTACKQHSDPPAADNTARNVDHKVQETADNASNAKPDIDITQQIRKAVMADDTLSTNAHNCKIVVKDGAVTLAGPVKSDAERTRVAELASQAAGGRTIDNQLQVAN
jgi:osmotically-inducible protein OsmY